MYICMYVDLKDIGVAENEWCEEAKMEDDIQAWSREV